MKVYIMRGLPGSGKTYWAARRERAEVVSADDWFTVNGVYQFDPAKLQDAHADCLRRYVELLRRGDTDVVVANTNTTAWEISPYYQLALAQGASVVVVEVKCSLELCMQRNVHNVPARVFGMMRERMLAGDLPGHWKVVTVTSADTGDPLNES